MKAKSRPLRAREGATFHCVGDGLCCSDVHGIGPVTESEATMLNVVHDGVARYSEIADAHLLAMRGDTGTCVFLKPMDEEPCPAPCFLHMSLPALKPRTCHRFPFTLTATPRGGRVGTHHRCPCRTMGELPPVDLEDAADALTIGRGISADLRVRDVPLTRRKRVDFATFEKEEAKLVAAMTRDLDAALGDPFPSLSGGQEWEGVAALFRSAADDSRAEVAMQWFGDGMPYGRAQKRSRPWSDAFDRAEARSEERDPDAMWLDWARDEIWSLRWVAYCGSLKRKKVELATRLAIARRIARRLVRKKVRRDRAVAEALMVVDVVGVSDWWIEVTNRMPG